MKVKASEKFKTIEEVLDFCIEQERASVKLYSALASLTEQPEISRLFQDLAEMEARHEQKFQSLKGGASQLCVETNVPEIEIREDLPPLSPGPQMSCQQVMGLAIKKEVIAAILYARLARIVEDENVRNVLWAVADEEMQHKHHFDEEYDKCVVT